MTNESIIESRKEQCYDLFNQAMIIIINDLELHNFSLMIFNKASIRFTLVMANRKPLASMALSYLRGKFSILMNHNTVSMLSPWDVAFLILHETLHYVLEHTFLYEDFPIRRKALNIAMDLIVNDILAKIFPEVHLRRDKYYFGQDTLGVDCSSRLIDDVFNDVVNLGLGSDDHDHLERLHKELTESLSESQLKDDITKLSSMFKTMLQSNSQNKNNIPSDNKQEAMGAGYGTQRTNTIVQDMQFKLKFDKVFKQLTGQSSKRGDDESDRLSPSWKRQPMSRIGIDPIKFGFLPIYLQEEAGYKKTIFLYVDVSGSISQLQLSMFTTLTNNIPKSKFEVKVYSFNCDVEEVPLDKRDRIIQIAAGGGTDFNCIAKHANEQKKYPHNILILTDGESSIDNGLVSDKYKPRWTWIIDGKDYWINNCKQTLFGRVFGTNETMKGLK